MFQVLGVFAEFERALIREGVMAGLVYGQRPKALDLGGPQTIADDAAKVRLDRG